MMDILLLRLDAPLMSFGGPAIDERRVTYAFPTRSMLTGLLANALGWKHREGGRLARLQARLRHASRCDRSGTLMHEYQTVDLGQDFMIAEEVGWTTRGRVERRTGGSAKGMTHQRRLEYHADSVHTVALALDPADEAPRLPEVEVALSRPARPLFIGRKCCPPAVPIVLGLRKAATLREALEEAPSLGARRQEPAGALVSAWWPEDEGEGSGGSRLLPVTDDRDWTNQIHGGTRLIRHGQIEIREAPHAD